MLVLMFGTEINSGLTSGQTEASFWNAGTEPDMPVGNRETLKFGEIRQLYDRDDLQSPQLYGQS